ncbi:MAG TPA: hypothetical protein PLL50_07380 [Propionicimonas sp.]|nr:hypothetical protein [Propionicimonas sp.]HQA78162.1 hypothetical protein [Propionicimonas sp.]HQD96320.1 hypothetical protein [Propionicimonas sp.]
MAVAIEAIRGFLHLFTEDWSQHDGSPFHVITVLDVLEPKHS